MCQGEVEALGGIKVHRIWAGVTDGLKPLQHVWSSCTDEKPLGQPKSGGKQKEGPVPVRRCWETRCREGVVVVSFGCCWVWRQLWWIFELVVLYVWLEEELRTAQELLKSPHPLCLAALET